MRRSPRGPVPWLDHDVDPRAPGASPEVSTARSVNVQRPGAGQGVSGSTSSRARPGRAGSPSASASFCAALRLSAKGVAARARSQKRLIRADARVGVFEPGTCRALLLGGDAAAQLGGLPFGSLGCLSLRRVQRLHAHTASPSASTHHHRLSAMPANWVSSQAACAGSAARSASASSSSERANSAAGPPPWGALSGLCGMVGVLPLVKRSGTVHPLRSRQARRQAKQLRGAGRGGGPSGCRFIVRERATVPPVSCATRE